LQDVAGHEAQGWLLDNNRSHHRMALYVSVRGRTETVTPIESHTGLYFDEIGQIFFYPTQWKVVSYVNLRPTQLLWKQVKAHQPQIVNYCLKIHNTTWFSLTDCCAFTPYIRSKVKYVEQLRDIVADYLFNQNNQNELNEVF